MFVVYLSSLLLLFVYRFPHTLNQSIVVRNAMDTFAVIDATDFTYTTCLQLHKAK